jgi:hypothetical protein
MHTFNAFRFHPIARWFLATVLGVLLYVAMLGWTIARDPGLRSGVGTLISRQVDRWEACAEWKLEHFGENLVGDEC